MLHHVVNLLAVANVVENIEIFEKLREPSSQQFNHIVQHSNYTQPTRAKTSTLLVIENYPPPTATQIRNKFYLLKPSGHYMYHQF
jgi:hypothetical protein